MSVYEKKDIQGMTISNKQLYVIFSELSIIDVYNTDDLEFERRISAEDIIDSPCDIAAINNVLFVSEYTQNLIARIQLPEETVTSLLIVDPPSTTIITRLQGITLSVTKDENIIALVENRNKLVEFTSTGRRVRTIVVDFNLLGLQHGVRMKDDHFIIRLSTTKSSRVCMIDNVGRLVKQVGGHPDSKFGGFHEPNYIALDKDGSLHVADEVNKRIVHLNSSLEPVKQLSSQTTGLTSPFRICLDQEHRQLYVREFLDTVFRIVIIDIDK